MSRGAVFFDRDRTLIADAPAGARSEAAHSPAHVRLLPGAIDALALARGAGLLVVVVTNQPGAAKGECSRADIDATNARVQALCAEGGAPLDGLFTCLHHPVGGAGGVAAWIGPCVCRKPAPGLLLAAARALGIELARSGIVGDRATDLAAGAALGLPGALVDPARGVDVLEATRRLLAAITDRATGPGR